MIVTAIIAYYVLAVALLALIGYAVAQQNAQQFKSRADEMIANLERFHTAEQADEPTAVVDTRKDGVASEISLRKHPESDAQVAGNGGSADPLRSAPRPRPRRRGVEFAGTVQTDTKLTLRLVMKSVGDVTGRIDSITKELNWLAGQTRRDVIDAQDADINAQIDAELASPIPRDVAEHLEPVAV